MKLADVIKMMFNAVAGATLCGSAAELPRVELEESKFPPAAISAFLDAVASWPENHMHSFMLLQHGKVLAEGYWAPYRAQDRSSLFSVSKTFTSTAVGFAVQEQKLDISQKVIEFFPEEVTADLTDYQRNLTVQDLLTMESGHAVEPWANFELYPEKPLTAFFSEALAYQPGTRYLYNSCASYMLSIIVAKAVGMPMIEYLKPRLFDKLGIVNPYWDADKNGNAYGGWGLWLNTEELATYGQFYLQNGEWHGEQLLNKAWIKQATAAKSFVADTDNGADWQQGYGLHFWRGTHNHFRGDGTMGQYVIVYPDLDAVLVMTGKTNDLALPLDTAHNTLIAALEGKFDAASSATYTVEVKNRLAGLALPVESGITSGYPAAFATALPQGEDKPDVKMVWNPAEKQLELEIIGQSVVVAPLGVWRANVTERNGIVWGRAEWKTADELVIYSYGCPWESRYTLKLNPDSTAVATDSNQPDVELEVTLKR